MNDDHSVFGVEELYIVHHFCLAAVQIQDCPSNKMFADKQPTFLVNEWRIWLSVFSRRSEDGVIVNFNNLVPRDEFIRAAHAMFDIKPYGLRKRLHELKNQISELPNFPVEISGANPAFEQAREVNQLVVLVERGCRLGRGSWL